MQIQMFANTIKQMEFNKYSTSDILYIFSHITCIITLLNYYHVIHKIIFRQNIIIS